MGSFRGLTGVGVVALGLLISLAWSPVDTEETTKSSFPEDLTSNYHNTLLVDYLQPEDFNESAAASLTSLTSSSLLKSKLIRAEQLWKTKRRDSSDAPAWENLLKQLKIWKVFQPSFNCPLMLENLGSLEGEGKWVCGFELYETEPRPQECVVYTFGEGNETGFEREWVERTDCKIFMFGHQSTADSPPAGEDLEIQSKVQLGIKDDGKSATLRKVLKDNDHGWIDVMYLNLGGQESSVLNQILSDFEIVLPFAQIIVNFNIQNETEIPGFAKLFQNLESRGLRPYHLEMGSSQGCIKPGGDFPMLLQYSFLNLRGKHLLLVGK